MRFVLSCRSCGAAAQGTELDCVRRLLDEPRLPREVRVLILENFSVKTLVARSGCLARLRYLKLDRGFTAEEEHVEWLQLLRDMPQLVELTTRPAIPFWNTLNEPGPKLPTGLCGWTADMVPSLARLTLKCYRWDLEQAHFRAAVNQLKLDRPHLSVDLVLAR